jgi:hypothetical protein
MPLLAANSVLVRQRAGPGRLIVDRAGLGTRSPAIQAQLVDAALA